MSVRAMLDGHEFDLAALARRFPTGDPRVVTTDEGTFIEAAALDAVDFTDAARLVEVAASILARLNGWAMLDDAGYRPVKLRKRFHRDREAIDTHIVLCDEARTHDEDPFKWIDLPRLIPLVTCDEASSSTP